ncbi:MULTISPECIES: alpha/beta hydrolase [Bifidobacterium]|uniref:alpha/beta hydrolase n=1 Tax=Bifidobacterium TaxID=1678 RepID=UPI001BDDBAA0|nr:MULTISPECIES: alpha/beta fold hydrolase [Bifidobacterium]MBT1162301.1 alpha/beta fold hydrolase [Bifidobacterium sp. SO1]MBW3078848.1 alpha/beta fold hydrolase [Bifidobacterium simiiventris]
MDVTHALTHISANGTEPVFLLLHGWGSNEHDLPSLLAYCAQGADYASLRAPIAYGMGYTWFGTWDYDGVPTGASLDDQAKTAGEAIDRWVAANIADDRSIVVMGFSQGGLLAGEMLRLNPQRYAAAVSFSGFLAHAPLAGDDELARLKPAMFYGRGSADDIFPPSEIQAMSDFYSAHTTLTERVYPGMTHSICMEEMRDVATFLTDNKLVRPRIW